MPPKILALFSSDARELYKADAYRVLALPSGYSIQLRYKRKYIDGATLAQIQQLQGRQGIVFFVSGNDTGKPEDARSLSLTSLRAFEVLEVAEDTKIETFNFYVKLGNFIDATPHSATSAQLLPPRAFVSELTVEEGPNNAWLNRVTSICSHFPNLTFFSIEGIFRGRQLQAPVFNRDTFSSEFRLDEDALYVCQVTFYDPAIRSTGIAASNSSPVVQLNVPANHRLGAQGNTVYLEVQTQALQQREFACTSYLWDRCGEVAGKPEPEAWRVDLKWRVRRGRGKAVLFGALTTAAAAGAALAKVATDNLAKTPASIGNWMLAILGGLAIAVCAGWLYEFFNKK